MPPPDSRIQAEIHPKAVVVSFLDSRITDITLIESLGEQLNQLIDRDGQVRVVLNFDRVSFMASYFLAKLLRFQARLETYGGRLVLCQMEPALLDILSACGMKKCFHIYKTEDEALRSF
ncbi:MAG: anti-sigma factor antagonist [Isosphaeraceae bacterium]|jgi:anti-anti-sigma factor|nr:MAG: anti-sigma factor antagonist [Isosphaeraceae bacterium]